VGEAWGNVAMIKEKKDENEKRQKVEISPLRCPDETQEVKGLIGIEKTRE